LMWAIGCSIAVLKSIDTPLRDYEDLSRKLGNVESAVSLMNLWGCLAGIVELAVLGYLLCLFHNPGQRIGLWWMLFTLAVGTVFFLYRGVTSHARFSVELSGPDSFRVFRSALNSHRNLELCAWIYRWLAIFPGSTIFICSMLSALSVKHEKGGFLWGIFLFFIFVVGADLSAWVHIRIAYKYQSEIDEVDYLTAGSLWRSIQEPIGGKLRFDFFPAPIDGSTISAIIKAIEINRQQKLQKIGKKLASYPAKKKQ
jgi:hypothetical protein